jgi:Zn-dependent M28 family amino/carboxypeptidase
LFKRNPAWNVVAESGDPDADRTLVFLAHHDAAPTGAVFAPGPLTELAARSPRLHGYLQAEAPLWWPATAAPALVALGAATGRRGVIAAGTALCALLTANMADIGRDRIVPGANDNLTAVAVLLALARAFAETPLRGLRVLLVSCGAEESFQGGVRAFAARHFPSLPPDRTHFVVLETLGSPDLKIVEGEGPLKMETFPGPELRDLVERVAAAEGIRLQRGNRFRFSSDSVIPARAGYPLAMLASQTPFPDPWTYHQMADTPDNIDLDALARAAHLSEAVARELAA